MAALNHMTDNVSVLGPTLRFKGELIADEDMQIHGQVEGTITHSKYLTICNEGHVKANVNGHIVAIQGTVEGNVSAETSVSVADTGHLTGDIHAPSISINNGADFNGRVVMEAAKPKASSAPERHGAASRPASEE